MISLDNKEQRGATVKIAVVIAILVSSVFQNLANAEETEITANVVTTKNQQQYAKPSLSRYVQEILNAAYKDLDLRKGRWLFEQEVLTHGELFLLNFRETNPSDNIKVDYEKLRNYLNFSADFMANPAAVCLTVRHESDCGPCETLSRPVYSALRSRLKRRGFEVTKGVELPGKFASGEGMRGEQAFEEFLVRSSTYEVKENEKNTPNCRGALYTEIIKDPRGDSSDTATRVQVKSFLQVTDKRQKKLQSFSNQSFTLATDFDAAKLKNKKEFIEDFIAMQTAKLFNVNAETFDQAFENEKYLRLEGVDQFIKYTHFKQQIQRYLRGLQLEERMIEPGAYTFAVKGRVSLGTIEAQVAKIPWGSSMKVDVLKSDQEELVLVIR